MIVISWVERKKNEEVLRRTGEDRSFLKKLKRIARQIGYVLRDNRLTKRVVEDEMKRKTVKEGHICMLCKDNKKKTNNKEEWITAKNSPRTANQKKTTWI